MFHRSRAAAAVSRAKTVLMSARTTWRSPLPAYAKVLRTKCTRQRCQVAVKTFAIAAFKPRCASEMTSFVPRIPRWVTLRRNLAQNVSASLGPIATPKTSQTPSVVVTPTAIMTATETMRPACPTYRLTYVASIQRYGQSPSMGRWGMRRRVRRFPSTGVRLGSWRCPSPRPARERTASRRPGYTLLESPLRALSLQFCAVPRTPADSCRGVASESRDRSSRLVFPRVARDSRCGCSRARRSVRRSWRRSVTRPRNL